MVYIQSRLQEYRTLKRLRNLETLRNPSTVKIIHKNHKLAFGSNSVIFMNNTASGFLRVSTVPADVSGSYISQPVIPIYLRYTLYLIHTSSSFNPSLHHIHGASVGRHSRLFHFTLFCRRPIHAHAPSRGGKLNRIKNRCWEQLAAEE